MLVNPPNRIALDAAGLTAAQRIEFPIDAFPTRRWGPLVEVTFHDAAERAYWERQIAGALETAPEKEIDRMPGMMAR